MINKNSSGFTLIELVVVIVIMGILAVTAAPRFLNLSADANKAAIRGLYASFQSSAQLAHSKSVVDGNDSQPTSSITLDGKNIKMVYGYPEAFNGIVDVNHLGDVAGYGRDSKNSEHDWVTHLLGRTYNGESRNTISIASGALVGDPSSVKSPEETKCFVYYYQATQTSAAHVAIDTSGC